MSDVVVEREVSKGLAGRPPPDQRSIGNELSQSTPALHDRDSSLS